MTLSFSTTWPKTMPKHMAGQPTDFVDLIWNCLKFDDLFDLKYDFNDWSAYFDAYYKKTGGHEIFGFSDHDRQKLHTIREDSNNRWQPGKLIHPVINNRTPKRFQFAPTIPCISTQKIEIIYSDEELCDWHGVEPVIKVDGRVLDYHKGEVDLLAANDGFKDTSDFCHWFNKDFTGKIIHWTDLKY